LDEINSGLIQSIYRLEMHLHPHRFIGIFVSLAVTVSVFGEKLSYSGRVRFHETPFSLEGKLAGEFEAEVLGWGQHHRFLTFPITSDGEFILGKSYRYAISDRSLLEASRMKKGEPANTLSKGAAYLYDRFYRKNWSDLLGYGLDEVARRKNAVYLQDALIVLEGKRGIDPFSVGDNRYLEKVLGEFGSIDGARSDAHLNDTRVRIMTIKDRNDKAVQSFFVWMPKPPPVNPASGFLRRFRGNNQAPPSLPQPKPSGIPIPDTGSTVVMVMISVFALGFLRRFTR